MRSSFLSHHPSNLRTQPNADDDFGVEWDGDLMRVDLEHSLMETAALVSAQCGGVLLLPTANARREMLRRH